MTGAAHSQLWRRELLVPTPSSVQKWEQKQKKIFLSYVFFSSVLNHQS